MPRLGFYGNALGGGADPLGIRPNVIRTAVDPLERQLKLAQIANLQSEGQDRAAARALQALSGRQEEAYRRAIAAETSTHNIEEEKRATAALGETGAHNLAEEDHWAKLIGVSKDQLAENARQHNETLGETSDYHKGLLKNQLTSDLITHFANNPSVDASGKQVYSPDVIMNMLSKRDVPELLAAKTEITGQQDAAKAQKDAERRAQDAAILAGKGTATAAGGEGTATPGYVPGLGGGLKYAPIDALNNAFSLSNAALLPATNLLGSLVGAPPVKKLKPIPRDYSALFQ